MRTEHSKKKSKFSLVFGFIVLLIIGFIAYNIYTDKQEKTKAIDTLDTFKTTHPTIEFPKEYDMKKEKKWDSGIVEYKLDSSEKDYIVHIKEQEVVKLWIKKPKQLIYPIMVVEVEKEEVVKEEAITITPPPAPPITTQEPMGKVAYTLEISKLLGDAMINIGDIEVLVENPIPTLNQQTIQNASDLLKESMDIYNEVMQLVPPVEWEKFHQNVVSMWNNYIVGEVGLVNSMKDAWSASSSEREKAMEIVGEKAEITGEYGIELGKLITQFLGELTGFTK